MIKYAVRFSLALVAAVLSVGIYFGCTEDETSLFFDLTGRWSGVVYNEDGNSHVELDLTQDTTGYVTGFVYTYDEKSDTVPISGIISEGKFAGTFNGNCVADFEMDLKNDSLKLTGTAVDRPGVDCGGQVSILLFKVIDATENITGTWSGTRKSTVSTDEESFTLNFAQTGNVVSGLVFSVGDTTTLNGRMLGNVFEGMVGDQSCDIYVYVEITGNSGKGVYVGGGGESIMGCTDRGTLTISRSTGKQIRK